eukprot:12400363-Karenia_brevis.AAC.1
MSDEQEDPGIPELNDDERDHIEELQDHMAKVSRQLMNKIGSVLTSFDDKIDEVSDEFKAK